MTKTIIALAPAVVISLWILGSGQIYADTSDYDNCMQAVIRPFAI